MAWSLGHVLISLIVIAAIVGIALVALRASGIPVPPWVWNIIWIVVVAFVAIYAIRFVLAM